MTQHILFPFRTFFLTVVFGLLLFIAPSHVFAACANKTQITNPLDGQNFVAPLPFMLKSTSIAYNIALINSHYYLDIYQGVLGDAQFVNRHSQRIAGCMGNTAVDNDTFTAQGDYFYVLYDVSSDDIDFTSWTDHWTKGTSYSKVMPDYAVSRFSIGSTHIPVVLVPGIGSAFNMDVLVKDKPPGSGSWNFVPGMPYDNFIKSLENAGYQLNKDLFVAYYDWRKSNDINASDNSVGAYLIPTIDKAKSLCGCSKVALVAHSMGGLAARSYMQSDLYSQRNDVSHLFLIGTPNQGSSNVYDLWEGGRIPFNWDKAMVGGIYAYIWVASDNKIAATSWKESGDAERYTTIHAKVPSVQQLLPTYNYLSLGSILQPFTNMLDQNPFLPTLNQNTNLLSQRTNLFTFVGKDQPTVDGIPADQWTQALGGLWADGLPDPKDPVPNDTNGDNQVLLSSSELSQALQQYTYSDDHGKIVTDSAPDIAKILANASIPQPDPFAEPQNSLVYAITSSADISITDPSGNTIGKTQNTIGSDAEYFSGSDPGDAKIVFINNPTAGNYQVNLKGEGNGGSFQMLAGSITQNGNDSSAMQQNTITSSQTITYNFSYQAPTDNSGTSITLTAADSTPPTISVQAPLQQNYNRSSTITIDVSSSDAGSGVSSTTITLDGTIKQNGDTVNLSALPLGDHTLAIDAEDNAGNDAEQTITFTNTVTTQDITKDIEKVASCGCISKKSVAQTLLNDTDAISQAADADAKQTAVQNFSQFLSGKRGKAISEGAYQLLLQDSHWIQ